MNKPQTRKICHTNTKGKPRSQRLDDPTRSKQAHKPINPQNATKAHQGRKRLKPLITPASRSYGDRYGRTVGHMEALADMLQLAALLTLERQFADIVNEAWTFRETHNSF